MKFINKNNPPKSLLQHLAKPQHNYDNYAEKDDLRQSLLSEQGFICCYCMKRIQTAAADKMKIEHFKPQSKHPELQLDYNNLLASCKGNELSPSHLYHCDNSKGNTEIGISPLNKMMMEQIRFDKNGMVFTENETCNDEINDVLKLNIDILRDERKAIINGLRAKFKRKYGDSRPEISFINNEIKKYETMKNRQSEAFCQVAIYWLKKELKRAT